MLQQKRDMNLYSFNKVSWCTGYDNKGQHFEKWVSATESYDNKTYISVINGGVTRGICKMDEENNLTEVVETKHLHHSAWVKAFMRGQSISGEVPENISADSPLVFLIR